jgi:hypothetical protein
LAAELPVDLDHFEAPEALSLVVAWKRGQGLDGGEVRTGEEVKGHLRAACERTVSEILERELREYTPDMQLEEGECLVASDEDMIAQSPAAQLLFPTAPLRDLPARELPRRAFQFYAVTLDADEGEVAFLRKTNPRRAGRAGGIVAALGNVLEKVTRPLFTFEDSFDLMVAEGTVVALNQSVFEVLFSDAPAIQARIPEWVEQVTDHLPIAGDGAQRLAERCATDGRLRRRLRAVAARGHLPTVEIQQVRDHLAELGLPESDYIDEQNPFRLMQLLNEDLFRGGLTRERFVSDRKSPQ